VLALTLLFIASLVCLAAAQELVRTGTGPADKSTVWAGGFNSIQGPAYHDGRVFVMHAPFMTVLGRGATKEHIRRDL
jgi:hypothetical protein